MEKLDIKNIIEVNRIRNILSSHPDLLSLFEIIIIMCNNRLNTESIVNHIPLEDNIEPELSDHESDED
tara:strand:- start:1988 stop:2191 length:204 start_codon:yes stop_codon:yes gene_type:complete